MRKFEEARRSWATRVPEAKDLPLPPAAPLLQAPPARSTVHTEVEEFCIGQDEGSDHEDLPVPRAAPLKQPPSGQRFDSSAEELPLPLPPPAPVQQAPIRSQAVPYYGPLSGPDDGADVESLDLPPPAPLKPAPSAKPVHDSSEDELPLPPPAPVRRAPLQVQVSAQHDLEEGIDLLELPPPAPLKPAPAAHSSGEGRTKDLPLPGPAPVQPAPAQAWVESGDGCRPRATQGRPVIPPLPLAKEAPVEQPVPSPEVDQRPVDVEDIRFWTVERYQMHRKKRKFMRACSCEHFEEQNLRLVLFAAVLILLGVLAIGARDAIHDRLVNEAVMVMGIIFVVLGTLTFARGCCVQDGDQDDMDSDHPDARDILVVGKPLL